MVVQPGAIPPVAEAWSWPSVIWPTRPAATEQGTVTMTETGMVVDGIMLDGAGVGAGLPRTGAVVVVVWPASTKDGAGVTVPAGGTTTAGLLPAGDNAGLYPAGDEAGLLPAADGAGMLPAADGAGLFPTAGGAGLLPAGDGAGLFPAAGGAGLLPAGDGAGLFPTADGAGLLPAADGAGLFPTADGAGLLPAGEGAGLLPAGVETGVGMSSTDLVMMAGCWGTCWAQRPW